MTTAGVGAAAWLGGVRPVLAKGFVAAADFIRPISKGLAAAKEKVARG
ncbi:hypothetical protein [Pararhizobium sp. A13]